LRKQKLPERCDLPLGLSAQETADLLSNAAEGLRERFTGKAAANFASLRRHPLADLADFLREKSVRKARGRTKPMERRFHNAG
jgi:hypothetical protein